MKTLKKTILALVIIAFCAGYTNPVSAQGTPPPPPSGGHGVTGNQPPAGGNAPIAGGIYLLLSLGAVYGFTKTWAENRKEIEAGT